MTITLEILDEPAGMLSTEGNDPSRAVLEAVALEGYRRDLLSEATIRRLLGLETRMEVVGILKEHSAFMHFTLEDLGHDTKVALDMAHRFRAELGLPPSIPSSSVPLIARLPSVGCAHPIRWPGGPSTARGTFHQFGMAAVLNNTVRYIKFIRTHQR